MSGVAEEEGDDGQGDLLDVLPAGTTLPGYELKSLLGQGAFGITYRARDLTLDATSPSRNTCRPRWRYAGAAPPCCHARRQCREFVWGRERFLDEARTLARARSHAGIVRVYDFLEANGTAYMVMALGRGRDPQRRLSARAG